MSTPIAAALANNLVSPAELTRKYAPLQTIIVELLGAVPNGWSYIDIWPPGYRASTLLVSGFLNLPLLLFGFSAPKTAVGLVMYAASCATKCGYCVKHCCAFALRRGVHADTLRGDLRSPRDTAAIAVAEALSVVPHAHTATLRVDLERHFGAANSEWLAMAVALMGFLNKSMGAFGVNIEHAIAEDVSATLVGTSWVTETAQEDAVRAAPDVDSVWTLLRVLCVAPSVLRIESAWTDRIPSDAAQCRAYIADNYHWDEPVLTAIRHTRARIALSVALRENLDCAKATLGIGCKALAAVVFAEHAKSKGLRKRAEKLADAMGVQTAAVHAAADGSGKMDDDLDQLQAIVVRLTRVLADSTSVLEGDVIREATTSLQPSQLVEIIVWVALLQPIYRLSAWYRLE